jgi:hypothetical protein
MPQTFPFAQFTKSPRRHARHVLPAVPADSNPLAFLPFLRARAQFVDHAGYFVSGLARIRHAGEEAFFRDYIAAS